MKNGKYILVKAPAEYHGKKYRGLYCYEHLLVWWKEHGYVPQPGIVVHHINGQHTDNRIENLAVLTNAGHSSLHGRMKKPDNTTCGSCKKAFRVRPWKLKAGRPLFCSRRCIGKYNFQKMRPYKTTQA